MEREELSRLANSLHERYGKKFHNAQEAMDLLLSLIAQEDDLSEKQLFNRAAFGGGKKKSHDSENPDSEQLKSHKKMRRYRRKDNWRTR